VKKVFSALLTAILALSLFACEAPADNTPKLELTPEATAVLSDLDKDVSVSPDAVTVTLADGTSTADGAGVTIDGDVITVTNAGTYVFSGTLSNGQIAVNADKLHKVHLIFNGVNVANNTTAPFYVINADKVIVTLTEGSSNSFSDIMRPPAAGEVEGEENANACIYAADDITFNGFGSLSVESSYNGISSKNDVRICGGTYTVNAANNGIKGKDSLFLAAGTVTVVAGKDGIKSDNADEAGRGYIHCCGATVNVQAGDDGIQAITKFTVDAGSVTVDAGDDAVNCDGEITVKEGCLTDKNGAA